MHYLDPQIQYTDSDIANSTEPLMKVFDFARAAYLAPGESALLNFSLPWALLAHGRGCRWLRAGSYTIHRTLHGATTLTATQDRHGDFNSGLASQGADLKALLVLAGPSVYVS